MVPEVGGGHGKIGEGGQNVQAFIFKINKSWGYNV